MEAPSPASAMGIVSAWRVNAARQVAVKVIAVQAMEVVEPMAVVKVLEVAEPMVVVKVLEVAEPMAMINTSKERYGSPRCDSFCELANLNDRNSLYLHANSGDIKQQSYASPEEAVKALIDVVKANNNEELLAIFGPGSEDVVFSGDEVDDKANREAFLNAYAEMNKLEKQAPDLIFLHVGARDWTMPIPIMKKGERWIFDTEAGREEILNRRIGRNELNVIELLHAYVDAQREYASKDRNGDGSLEFAQKLVSTNGKHDGLH